MAKKGDIHTTNYTNAFIEVAIDCPVTKAEVPPQKKGDPSIAQLQFEKIGQHPYRYTSDEILFEIVCQRKGLIGEKAEREREVWFSKGQACLRASPLPKRYGWGIHHDGKSRIALVPLGSKEYTEFLKNDQVRKFKAMRSSNSSYKLYHLQRAKNRIKGVHYLHRLTNDTRHFEKHTPLSPLQRYRSDHHSMPPTAFPHTSS